ncbi:MAG TPA: hypothetical protein VFE34_23160 [Dongiaceae bacterium]|jgi:hypothetical protein|nr:hypothetical protein [Dongiaceae bacterium]
MPKPSRLTLAKQNIVLAFQRAPQQVYSKSQLEDVLTKNRATWELARRTSTDEFVEFLTNQRIARSQTFVSDRYGRQIVRYSFGRASPYALALSIQAKAYLCYATALNLHGLANVNPKLLYLNSEQSPKPDPSGALAQDRIDNAFKKAQRLSNLIYGLGDLSFTIVSGKHTKGLGVEEIRHSDSETLAVTNLERTLVDIAVRPAYAGGISLVLKAYRAAKVRVSVDRLLKILKDLDYRYPYHQSIGFLMQKVGYPQHSYAKLRALGLHHDFYLDYNMQQPAYSPDWRLYHPAELSE